jgi:hypothetical protein
VLIPLASNPGIGTMTQGYSVPLSILKVGILDCVGKGITLVQQLGGEGISWSDFLFASFLGLMGHLLQAGAPKWFHQMAGL